MEMMLKLPKLYQESMSLSWLVYMGQHHIYGLNYYCLNSLAPMYAKMCQYLVCVWSQLKSIKSLPIFAHKYIINHHPRQWSEELFLKRLSLLPSKVTAASFSIIFIKRSSISGSSHIYPSLPIDVDSSTCLLSVIMSISTEALLYNLHSDRVATRYIHNIFTRIS